MCAKAGADAARRRRIGGAGFAMLGAAKSRIEFAQVIIEYLIEYFRFIEIDDVARVRDLDELRTGYRASEIAAWPDGLHVARTDDDERRNFYATERFSELRDARMRRDDPPKDCDERVRTVFEETLANESCCFVIEAIAAPNEFVSAFFESALLDRVRKTKRPRRRTAITRRWERAKHECTYGFGMFDREAQGDARAHAQATDDGRPGRVSPEHRQNVVDEAIWLEFCWIRRRGASRVSACVEQNDVIPLLQHSCLSTKVSRAATEPVHQKYCR
jgi:hypothetical protein